MLPALMHAAEVPRPFHNKGWVYEEKYDGWRMLAHKDSRRVRLVSRNGRDHTERFADLVATLTAGCQGATQRVREPRLGKNTNRSPQSRPLV